jgi:Na+-driven multidrug efflux pump
VPILGIYGGAWATFIAYGMSAVILWYLSMRLYPIPYEWSRIVGTTFVTVLLFGVTVIFETSFIVNVFVILLYPIILFASGILDSGEKQIITKLFRTK